MGASGGAGIGGGATPVRDVALVGHHGSGKTTLAEALLHRSGALARQGRVEDGTTTCDSEPEEKERRASLSLAVAPFEWRGCRVNLIDTPGSPDFWCEVEAGLRAADLVVVVVSAVEGVEAQAEQAWRRAAELGKPRMIFVSKLDRERADFDRTLAQLRDRFGAHVEPIELPIGAERSFGGVADLLKEQAYVYEAGRSHVEPIPEALAEREHAEHDHLVEAVVEGDDELLERFFAGEVPTPEELEATLAAELAAGTAFPVLCGSSVTGVGIDHLADLLCELAPAPEADASGPVALFVFKTIADPYVGQLALFKVVSGTLRADDRLVNARTGAEERLHGLFRLRGREQVPVTSVGAGDLAAVAKLAGTATGDTLAAKGAGIRLEPLAVPRASYAVAVRPRTQADDDKLGGALHRLQDEDPALRVERREEGHQTVLLGVGEAHVAVALERLRRKFAVNVDAEDVLVPYRETVTQAAEAEGRYKKQTGGHGQFGVAVLRVEPLERGAGFEFVDAVVGGAIPRQFIPAVQKGVEEAMAAGGVHGHRVVDVRVTCLDGKYHPVDSSEMSFKMAGALAFREALAKAGPVVLEPVDVVRVVVPSALQGDVLGDLNSRRGRVLGTQAGEDGDTVVEAQVPEAELARYAIDLRSMTSGRGRFEADRDHYEPVPPTLAARLVKAGASS